MFCRVMSLAFPRILFTLLNSENAGIIPLTMMNLVMLNVEWRQLAS